MDSLLALGVYFLLLLGVVALARLLGRWSLVRTTFAVACCAPLVILFGVLLVLAVYGWIGEVYGVAYQIWHPNPDHQFLGGVAASLLVAGLLVAALMITPVRGELLSRKAVVADRFFEACVRRIKRSSNEDEIQATWRWLEEALPYRYMRFVALGLIPALLVLTLPVAALWSDSPFLILNYPEALYSQTTGLPWLLGLIAGAAISLVGITGLVWLCLRIRRFDPVNATRPVLTLRRFDFVTPIAQWIRKKLRLPLPPSAPSDVREGDSGVPEGYKSDLVRLGVIAAFLLFASFSIGLGQAWYPPPMVSFCSLAALLTAIYVLLCHRNPFAQLPALLILALVLTLVNGFSLHGPARFKIRFLDADKTDGGLQYYYSHPVNLNDRAYIENSVRKPSPSSIPEEVALNAWLEQCRKSQGVRQGRLSPDWKPKLVVVTTSGGASLAAVWTAVVLTELEARLAAEKESFPAHVRLVSGASGGMLGAGYYVSALEDPADSGEYPRRAEREQFVVDHLTEDFLKPVVAQGVFRDIPTLLCPSVRRHDRGTILEEQWWRATRQANDTDSFNPTISPLAKPFRELAEGERRGWRPSLVYSPMLVEDGRRLLISNLDLFTIGRNHAPTVTTSVTPQVKRAREEDRLEEYHSLGAIEFFQVFPRATGLRLSTAIRMSATFPYVSPAVYLPTQPPRRVVDAGYFDNYGVHLAATWIRENRKWLVLNTSGVLMIQIRAFGEEQARQRFIATGDPKQAESSRSPSLGAGSDWLTTPLSGLVNSWRGVMAYRNDEQAELVGAILNEQEYLIHHDDTKRPWGNSVDPPTQGNPIVVRTPPGFFRTVVFEAPGDVSMSWCLTDFEKQLLKYGMKRDIDGSVNASSSKFTSDSGEVRAANLRRVENLLGWWKNATGATIARNASLSRE